MALHMHPDYYNARTNINFKELYRTCHLIANRMGMPIPHNKAIVGVNAFAHSSGIHQAGVLKDCKTYEIISPELIGLQTSDVILSARSGRAALRYRLEVLGYRLTQEALNAVYQRFLTVADRKKEVFDEDLRAIMNDQVVHMPETFRLEHLAISSVSGETPRASSFFLHLFRRPTFCRHRQSSKGLGSFCRTNPPYWYVPRMPQYSWTCRCQ